MKNKVKTHDLVYFLSAVLGIAAIFLLLAPGITKSITVAGHTTSDSTSGFALMFGTGDGAKFNVMFIALVCSIVGVVGVILSFVLKNKKIGKFIAFVGFIAAGVLYFMFRAFYPMCMENGKQVIATAEVFGYKFKLGAGAIVAGVLSLLSGLGIAASVFMKK